MTRIVLRIALAAACSLPMACSLPVPKSNEPIILTIYDLGPPRAYAASGPAIAGALAIPAVTAPAWVDDGIAYRLLYEDPSRLHAYTRSRWSSDPAALLTERMRSRFAAVARGVVSPLDSTRSDYTLRVELRDFSQSLASVKESHVTLRARATLTATADRALVAQREFEVRRPAGPDADGAVKALAESTDAFLEDLVRWTQQNLQKAKP